MASQQLGQRRNLIMTNRLHQKAKPPRALRVGFVPLCDCAPFVVAEELGLFTRQGLRVELSREAGWATIRDKIIYRELDAAHATAPMVMSATLGLASSPVECLTGLVLNLHGNAITLSNRLWDAGVRDGSSLREFIRARRGQPPLVLGVVFKYSTHNFLLRKWLRENGLNPERDVRIVVVPPPQMAGNLRVGNLDGYCVGEPWNSVAVRQRAGWVVATSGAISRWHPEKVLMVRRDFAESRAEEHLRLIAALAEACSYCEQLENRERLLELLAHPRYVSTSTAALRTSLCGPFDFGKERVENVAEFHIFSRHNANEPTSERAAWVLENLRDLDVFAGKVPAEVSQLLRGFRPDIYRQAVPAPAVMQV